MLIVEHFFLIACDPRSGLLNWPRKQDPDRLAAAAIVLDLAEAERVQLREQRLHADSGFPLAHPLLSDAMHLLAEQDLDLGSALQRLVQQLDPLAHEVLDGLFRRDVLHCVASRDWLLRRRVRYPLRSMQARNEALQRLQTATSTNDFHGLCLIMLADQGGLLALHLQARDHTQAMQRLLALNALGPQAPPAARMLAAVRAALLA